MSIQSAGKIGTAPGGTVGRVVSEQPLATYSLIRNVLIEEATEFGKLSVNKNNSISTHQNSVSNKYVSLKSGKTTVGGYTYSTSKDGVITKAELTVSTGKTLTLPAGTYYLTKLTLYDGATLNTNGGTIFLTGAVYLHKGSKLTASLRCLPTGNSEIKMRGSASLTGTILAPDWNVISPCAHSRFPP